MAHMGTPHHSVQNGPATKHCRRRAESGALEYWNTGWRATFPSPGPVLDHHAMVLRRRLIHQSSLCGRDGVRSLAFEVLSGHKSRRRKPTQARPGTKRYLSHSPLQYELPAVQDARSCLSMLVSRIEPWRDGQTDAVALWCIVDAAVDHHHGTGANRLL
jgi:hypothetical protein